MWLNEISKGRQWPGRLSHRLAIEVLTMGRSKFVIAATFNTNNHRSVHAAVLAQNFIKSKIIWLWNTHHIMGTAMSSASLIIKETRLTIKEAFPRWRSGRIIWTVCLKLRENPPEVVGIDSPVMSQEIHIQWIQVYCKTSLTSANNNHRIDTKFLLKVLIKNRKETYQ